MSKVDDDKVIEKLNKKLASKPLKVPHKKKVELKYAVLIQDAANFKIFYSCDSKEEAEGMYKGTFTKYQGETQKVEVIEYKVLRKKGKYEGYW